MATPAQEKAVQRAISGIESSYKKHVDNLDFMYDSQLQWLQAAIRSAREKFALSSLLKKSTPTTHEVKETADLKDVAPTKPMVQEEKFPSETVEESVDSSPKRVSVDLSYINRMKKKELTDELKARGLPSSARLKAELAERLKAAILEEMNAKEAEPQMPSIIETDEVEGEGEVSPVRLEMPQAEPPRVLPVGEEAEQVEDTAMKVGPERTEAAPVVQEASVTLSESDPPRISAEENTGGKTRSSKGSVKSKKSSSVGADAMPLSKNVEPVPTPGLASGGKVSKEPAVVEELESTPADVQTVAETIHEQVKENKKEPASEAAEPNKVTKSDAGSKKSKSPVAGKVAPAPVQAPDDDMEIAGESEDEVVDQKSTKAPESTKAPVIASPPNRRSSARLRVKSDEVVEKKEDVQEVSKKVSPTLAVGMDSPSALPSQTSAPKEAAAAAARPVQNPAPQPPVSSAQTSRRHSMMRPGPSAAKAKEDVKPQNNTLDNIMAMKLGTSSHAAVSSEKESKQGGAIASNASKPTNLVGGLHSFTSLMKPQRPPGNAPASGSVHRPEVNALKKADEARKAQLAKEEERKARKAKVEKIMQMRMQERQMDVARLEMEAQRKKAENAAKRKEREEREEKLKHQPNAIHAPEEKKPRLEQNMHKEVIDRAATDAKNKEEVEKKKAPMIAPQQLKIPMIDKENTSTKAPAPVNTAAKPMIRPPFKAAENAAPSSSTTTNVPKATSQVLKENSGNAPKDHHKTSAEVIKPVSVQPMKPAVQQCPAPSSARLIQHSAGESYEISDREDSSDEDYDYSDEEEAAHKKAHKKVPDWARGDALKMAIRKQYDPKEERVDPDSLFREIRTCDLEQIFKTNNKRKFRERQSTGNWTKDALKSAEKRKYKVDTGFK